MKRRALLLFVLVIHLLYLEFELGAVDIHPRAQALPHHHAHGSDAHHAAVQMALHATKHALEQI